MAADDVFVDAHDWEEEVRDLQKEIKKEKRAVSEVRKDLKSMEHEVASLRKEMRSWEQEVVSLRKDWKKECRGRLNIQHEGKGGRMR